ncbi:MAG: DUF1266 domain-containing protein [Deltaproteobacteria bacterium]|nr:DUF1266 domain-containing protein [Nannocystaceae bacterium]
MLHAVMLSTRRVLVLAVAALLALWWLRRKLSRVDPQRLMTQRLQRDGGDLYKRWVQNTFLVVTGNCDFAHLPRAEAIRMLSAWWEVHGPAEHRRSLAGLADAGRPDNAWDLVRFVLLARIGVAAGYLDDISAWAEIRPIAIRLQRAYPDWSAMAQAYLMARRQARGLAADGTEDDASTAAIRDNVAHLHGTRWREMPYRLRLGDVDG